jgi:hypothetical protein
MLEEARRQEIADRKVRNNMRGMLFLLKGSSSANPFCAWVNDPPKPEELPPDWTPARSELEPLPDDPPF